MRYIDLRSDTVTQPTQAMREAMYHAQVGDDVFQDDPTVNELEALAADILGKEDALFVTSGTQGNAICFMAHTRRGDAVILGRDCHIAGHEAGSYAMLAGVSPCFPQEDLGILRPDSVAELIQDDGDILSAPTGLLCLENALSNGNVVPVENLAALYALANDRGIPVHLDGARLFNAATCLEVDVREMTRHCDSVMCCLSKGLCAPVGSVVAGSRDFIRRARKIRKILGGGMRQAGFLAAAGRIALTEMTGRLREDHRNAQHLAKGLAAFPDVSVREDRLKINMVFFTLNRPSEAVDALPSQLLELGIQCYPAHQGEFRLMTHHDISTKDCDQVVAAIGQFLR